ncbi:uncharacterized protein LOC114875390 isoform X1 [Osmia bicornis bicornis]|uniref:uncharacterized protein LOC114875390 isoform X1 n=1 Tax=Osmia bicornis bicornis TaxID=1437191 RepID=UPI001EAEED3A|nr:uncharacterized protein LOC114875390 isoform X1 [Osmia bicornis bicornis]XP_029041437.2 uncharacterized protein LOC114875390 isoform X1 [Osmia bicornis bicornis]XP_029041438.2 uncharacterized protein LOC114875390 isoform X1 [Osmia bicornis bicornis]XP_029041439.2 uncharacterized protein LOC114875390 isoform X1 [Osmia bicornis bicornis]XP_029041440.2 uncharacterized protein LOC114875390 isoform X1 [Osmia bicornis bicornis]
MENEGSPSVIINESPEGIRGWIESVIITASQTSVGQALFKLLDSFLWVVEKSAQWSLPSHEVAAEENGKVFGKIELVRPLPWVLFLPGLVILRIIRVGLNVGAFVLGYPKIQPSGMVKFVQKGRRRLRAFNLKAVKSVRRTTKDKRLTMIEAKKALIRSIRLTLSTLSCLDSSNSSPSPPPTKIHVSKMELEPMATPDEKSTTESVGSPINTKIKRKFSEVSSDNESTDESETETLDTKLERLALESSTDDPDFNPAECSSESSSASSENEVEKEMSLEELVEVQEEAKEFYNNGEEKPVIISLENLKRNSRKDEELGEEVKHVDSSESKLETVSSITNEFINGEISSTIDTRLTVLAEEVLPPASVPAPIPAPASVPAPVPAPAPEVIEKVSPKKSPPQIPAASHSRNFIAKENSSTIPERKGYKHKKPGRRETK